MPIYNKLEQPNKHLPPITTPSAAYVPTIITVNLVFAFGHIAKKDGQSRVGKLGQDKSTAESKFAARAEVIDLPRRTIYDRWGPQLDQAHCQGHKPCQSYAQLFKGTPAHQ